MFWNRSRPHVADVTPAEAHERLVHGDGVLVDVRQRSNLPGGSGARLQGSRLLRLPRPRSILRHGAEWVQLSAPFVADGGCRA